MARDFMGMRCLAALAMTIVLIASHAVGGVRVGDGARDRDVSDRRAALSVASTGGRRDAGALSRRDAGAPSGQDAGALSGDDAVARLGARVWSAYARSRSRRSWSVASDIEEWASWAGRAASDPVVAVAGGYDHNLALTRDGRVYAWGANSNGQLGDGGKKSGSVPAPVTGLPARDPVAAIAAGASHSLALTRGGRVYAWGANRLGQLGDGLNADSAAPVAVRGLPPNDPGVAIAAGGLHNLALTRSGRVYAWGANSYGQIGPAGVGSYSAVPVLVAGLAHGSAVVALAAGIAHSAALTRNGSVEAWGDDSVGQLGLVEDGSAPVVARGLPAGDPVAALAGGGLHNLALTREGRLYAWGDDSAGQLGVVGQGYISSVPLACHRFPLGTSRPRARRGGGVQP